MLAKLFTVENAAWLLDLLVKSAVLLALAGMAALACRRASAALRHLVWTLAIAGVLLLPLLSAILPAWHVARLPEWRPIAAGVPASVTHPAVGRSALTRGPHPQPLPQGERVTVSEGDTPPAVGRSALPRGPHSQPALTRDPHPTLSQGEREYELQNNSLALHPDPSARPAVSWYWWLTLAWGLGALVVLVGWGYGYAVTRHILRRAQPAPEAWVSLLGEAASKLNVRLLLSDAIAVPVVMGLFHPAILLPAQATEWPEERRRVVLAHELAHLCRGDLLAHLLAQLACASTG